MSYPWCPTDGILLRNEVGARITTFLLCPPGDCRYPGPRSTDPSILELELPTVTQ